MISSLRASSTCSHLKRVVLREIMDDVQGLVIQLQICGTDRWHKLLSHGRQMHCETIFIGKNLPKAMPLSSRNMLYEDAIMAPLLETMPRTSTTPLSSSSSWHKTTSKSDISRIRLRCCTDAYYIIIFNIKLYLISSTNLRVRQFKNLNNTTIVV